MQRDHLNRQRLYEFASRDDIRLTDVEATHVYECHDCRQFVRSVIRERLNASQVLKAGTACVFSGQRRIRRSRVQVKFSQQP